MIIRSETTADYAAIGALHARAFGNRVAEPIIVPLLRQRRTFDPELSLVAEIDGHVVGHALFSPYQMHVLGQTIPVVNLAPLGIAPAYQRQGIGGKLLVEGQRIARTKGYQVSILLGHTSYYPRFGYQMRAFGSAQVMVSITRHSQELEHLEMRSPTDEDIVALNALWLYEEGTVDMTLEPGSDLLDWLSPNPAIQATVYTRNGEIVGYTRAHAQEPTSIRFFLARNHEVAQAMVAQMASGLEAVTAFALPLHPSSASAAAFGQATCSVWDAAMAYSLTTSGPFDEYIVRLQRGELVPGRVLWPVAFDLV
jgi:putative acetyltransferase